MTGTNDRHPSERAIRALIGAYRNLGLGASDICARFRLLFARRGLGTLCMAAKLSWYGLRA